MDFLTRGEKIYASVHTSRRHSSLLKYYIPAIILLILSALIFFGAADFNIDLAKDISAAVFVFIALILIVIGELRRYNTETHITNYRIVRSRGILNTKVDAVSYANIVNVKMSQTLLEKFFSLGNVEVSTSRGHQEIDLIGIKNPKDVEGIIYTFIEKHT